MGGTPNRPTHGMVDALPDALLDHIFDQLGGLSLLIAPTKQRWADLVRALRERRFRQLPFLEVMNLPGFVAGNTLGRNGLVDWFVFAGSAQTTNELAGSPIGLRRFVIDGALHVGADTLSNSRSIVQSQVGILPVRSAITFELNIAQIRHSARLCLMGGVDLRTFRDGSTTKLQWAWPVPVVQQPSARLHLSPDVGFSSSDTGRCQAYTLGTSTSALEADEQWHSITQITTADGMLLFEDGLLRCRVPRYKDLDIIQQISHARWIPEFTVDHRRATPSATAPMGKLDVAVRNVQVMTAAGVEPQPHPALARTEVG
jgi:hypothetical protein